LYAQVQHHSSQKRIKIFQTDLLNYFLIEKYPKSRNAGTVVAQ